MLFNYKNFSLSATSQLSILSFLTNMHATHATSMRTLLFNTEPHMTTLLLVLFNSFVILFAFLYTSFQLLY